MNKNHSFPVGAAIAIISVTFVGGLKPQKIGLVVADTAFQVTLG